MKKLNDNEIHEQLMKEIKATFILIAIVAVWHVGFAFLLDGIDVMILGMPLWFFVSTIGAFVISVVGVVFLLKKVFVNFELGEEVQENEEEGKNETSEMDNASKKAQNMEGGDEA
ncbi:MAG: YhdT family protein [Lachnospiraceae bacterium]|nr:YhdT family protein [Lachnospiraceae bacterium]